MIHWLAYALVALAAVFDAVCDRLENAPAYNKSIFRLWDPQFWLKEISWQFAKKIGAYKIDGWHLAKSAWVTCFAFAVAFPPPHPWWVVVGGCGVVWNLTFNVCYNKLFKK